MPKNADVRITTTVVAYTSFCDGHVTRFSSLRTSLKKRRQRSKRPPAASLTVSNRPVSSATFRTHFRPPSRVALRRDSLRSDATLPSRSSLAYLASEGWQARRESNPQPPVLETGALPIELLAYILRIADCGLRIQRTQRIQSPINPQSAIRNPHYFDSL